MTGAGVTVAWTTLADVRRRLRRRWDSGEFLSAWVVGAPCEPFDIPLRGPAPAELAERFDEARAWVAGWVAAQQRSGSFHLDSRAVGRRSIGANEVPSRLWIDSYDELWQVLGVRRQVQRFAELREATGVAEPRLLAWLDAHPMTVLTNEPDWLKLVRTARWIEAERGRGRYLRQVPVPGVDTKFIESRRVVLTDLLDELLSADSVDRAVPRSQFARRYGFATKPAYVRFRLLDATLPTLPGVSEVTLRADEFGSLAPNVSTVYVVENEITYLAFPPARDSLVIFGSGYALSGLASLPWLTERRVRYWGDLDTHGFAILNQLRTHLSHVESLLMDRRTLLDHREQWVAEPTPTKAALTSLGADEAELYCDLVEDTLGSAVRLEQERIGFAHLECVLAP